MISAKPKTKRIGKFHFRLIGKPDLYFKGEHVVSFTPLPKNKQKHNTKIIPTFNCDRKHYTYSFRIPSSTPQCDQEMQQEHEKRVVQSTIELSQLMVPKPRSRHKYCGVCRNHYQDYKEHIQGEMHLTNLKKSQYQVLINQACDQYQQTLRAQKKGQEEVKVLDLTTEEVRFKPRFSITLDVGFRSMNL